MPTLDMRISLRPELHWRLSYTTSDLYDSSEAEDQHDCDYSVSEISESFTFRWHHMNYYTIIIHFFE